MKRVLLPLVIGCALSACESATVPLRDAVEIYDFRLVTPEADSLVLRWPTGAEIHVHVNPNSDPERTASLRDALRRGIDAWHDAALYGEFRLIETTEASDAAAILTWSTDALPVDVTACPPGGSRAYTTFCRDDSGEHLEPFPMRDDSPGRVRFILTVRTTEGGDQARVDALVAHELGHLLGIARHSGRTTDLMYEDQVTLARPNARDRATLHVLYHTRPDITP